MNNIGSRLLSFLRPATVGSSYDLFSAKTRSDPYPVYAQLRAQAPVWRDPDRGWYVVSRYDDVVQILRDAAAFSAAEAASFEATLLGSDPPAHTHVRRVLERLLGLKEPEMLDRRFRQLVAARLAGLAGRRDVEVIGELAAPLPLLLILELLGLSDQLYEQAAAWSHAMVSDTDDHKAALRFANDRSDFMQFALDYVRDIEQGRVEAGWAREFVGTCGSRALVDVVRLLVVAGTETSTNLIGNCLLQLVERPGVLEACLSNGDLVPHLVEETLRYESPVQWTRRLVRMPRTLAGIDLPVGATVIALIGSANRDERRFVNPDHFEVPRSGPSHIAFGFGAHYCMGAALARREARAVLDAILPFFSEGVQRTAHSVEWHESPQIRGLIRLPLRFEARFPDSEPGPRERSPS